ncbi:MAG: DUF1570 domain-containing protein [Pirellulales bacterium]
MLSRRHALGLALATAETVLRGGARAETAATTGDAPTTYARLAVASAAGPSALEGRIVAEAADGGLLLELASQRYVVVQPGEIRSREPVAPPAPESPRDLGRRILAELPAGFDLHLTRHYVVCFNTSRDYAKWAAALFERLHEAFGNFWRQAGLEPRAADRPLVVVIFARRADYEAYAARDLGAAADRIAGYYNFLSNRVTTYDLTGSGTTARPGRIGDEILAQPEAAGLVSTLVHEATHQMVYNTGLAQRLAPVPVWLNEGIATVFEAPDMRAASGWRGLGQINRSRLERFRTSYQAGSLEPLIRGDETFRNTATALDAYAAAWALTWFLLETRKPQLIGYMRVQAAKPALADDSPEARLREFTDAFGASPADLEPAFIRHLSRLELRRP